jgi:hypothetical protein
MDDVICDAVPEVVYVPVRYINVSILLITLNFWHFSHRYVIALKISTLLKKPLGSTNFLNIFRNDKFLIKTNSVHCDISGLISFVTIVLYYNNELKAPEYAK